jgi:hypothetical protein
LSPSLSSTPGPKIPRFNPKKINKTATTIQSIYFNGCLNCLIIQHCKDETLSSLFALLAPLL